ncbi:sulfite exporter TauE/SafE family protein [Acuticoccus mangrovi]|uniref:Probable membrane transporter protein n=1 Tax=Acuticoccus mangrovi TaxID=2796142 RepID=A0A934IQX4_9HYPH|nr:sulfite exporter TauE/SafE family protein [Acuticoccus mangrovi]MBJ3776978.1 sulfite exporter TauE/SafE family protein [Acuticoccus mangrovi]
MDNMTQILELAVALLLAGAVTGILAGVFGVGGGAITVPVLFEAFTFTGVADEVRMPLAVGTSLAVIIPTSIRSARAHARRGAVDRDVLKIWAVPLMAGVIIGAGVARYAPPLVFQIAFIIVAVIVSVKLLFGRQSWKISDTMPARPFVAAMGSVVGLLSALMGVGGGSLSTLILTLYGRPIHTAVATSAGVGVIISIPGAIGYVLAGWGQPNLPPDAIGYVSLIGFALVVPATLITAPIGAALAHQLPRRALEISFGLFLTLVSIRFIVAAFS